MDSLDDELQNLSKKDNSDWKKFTPLATGVGNCVFIGTTVSYFIIILYTFNSIRTFGFKLKL